MAKEKVNLAIFDFDGTLTTGHLWEGVARHHREKRVKRRRILVYFLSHLPFWLASKVKLYSKEKDRVKWGEDLSALFKNFTVEEGRSAFEWVTDNYILPLMRKDVLDILVRHQQNNEKIVILSGMFTDFLNVVGQRLGIDYVVGTELERVDGKYSGRIIPPLCFGENKARMLKEFIQANQLEVDFARSYAYADSIYDIPVFRMVGNPVATYPDKELGKLARQEKWPIIGCGRFK
jgi:HAD superfamily hydrolase (TIGR01490 family)